MKKYLIGLALFVAACNSPESSNNSKAKQDQQAPAHEDSAQYGISKEKGATPKGIPVGEQAPHFEGKDQEGNDVNLEALLKQQPVVLFFYRGQWCPVCNRYLSNFQDSLNQLKKAGANVIAVTPELPRNVNKTVEQTGASFSIIADTTHSIMDQYGVGFNVTEDYVAKIQDMGTNIAANNGDEEAVLPVPATYVISENGKIAWRHFDLNYKNRAPVSAIKKALTRL